MPVETRELTIDGHEVKVVPFVATRGILVSAKLMKLLMPLLGTVLPTLTDAALKNQDSGKELDIGDINIDKLLPAAFQKLSEELEPEAFLQLLMELLSGTFIDGDMIDKVTFDKVFTGNYSLSYRIAFEVIKANHFFDLGVFGNVLNKLPMLKALTGKTK